MLISLFVMGIITVIAVFLPEQTDSPLEETKLQDYRPVKEKIEKSPSTKSSQLIVDVKGAVYKPGIYELNSPARAYQAIQKAGGARDIADLNRVNLAEEIKDGMVIYVPKKGEEITSIGQAPAINIGSSQNSDQKVNINKATLQELEELEGLGPAKAKAIIKYREEHGPFRTVDDLTGVPGIGEKTLNRFREQITV